MYDQNYFGGGGVGPSQIQYQPQAQIGYQNNQKMHRSISNTNVSNSDCHVEYEVSMPVPIIRHTPSYHSLWNLHQW